MAYPIFLSGTGRSGTSMLFEILKLHPLIYAFGEAKFIEHAYLREFPKFWEQSDKNPQYISELKTFVTGPAFKFNIAHPDQIPRFRGLHLMIEEKDLKQQLIHLEDIKFCQTAQNVRIVLGRFFDSLFTILALNNGKMYWAEKTPENSIYPDLIYEMFPSMKFLNIIRDGRDVACSVMQIKEWKMTTVESSMEWWASRMTAFIEKSKNISQDFFGTIKYEEFVDNYPNSLKGVLNFLGLPYAPELKQFNMKKSSIGRWQSQLNQSEVQFCKDKYGKLLESLGYEV